jgi:hypothetical protein
MKTEEKIWTVLIVYGLVAFTLVMMLISCKTPKYSQHDCYKTHYKPIKKDKHKHPQCDAYN